MQPPQSIEEIKAGLETTEKGGVRQSIRNCLTVFQRDPLLSGAIAYNILTDRKDIIKPIGFHRESTALNDTDMKYLLLYLEETYGLTNEKKIDNAIGIVANENKYHPIRDYLSALVWDGTERIRFCLRHFLGADADDYTYEALKLFLLGAISRAFQPGCKFEIMLCLVGGQGAGKSTFFRLLAARDEWFSDDLRKLDDDNVYRKLQGHWIIEMSEMMATANAKSIEEIKSFLSRQKEVYKIPYETHPADRPRQCVFGGTSNALDFLPLDRSGNRRFIPVMVYPEQAEVHILEDEAASRAYIEQMWAEAMEIYRSGRFKLAFSPAMQRYLKEHQRDLKPLKTSIYQHIAAAVCRCCVRNIRRVYCPPFRKAGFIISSSPAFVNRRRDHLSVSCFTLWFRPVAAQPDTMPTAAALSQSCAGKSGTPIAQATTPRIRPAAPQMIGIHLSAASVALTAMPSRYAMAVIAATDAMPKSIMMSSS